MHFSHFLALFAKKCKFVFMMCYFRISDCEKIVSNCTLALDGASYLEMHLLL